MPTALVTGASSGIGWEIAKELARQGIDLVLVARREDKLRELEELLSTQVSVAVLTVDLSRDDAPQTLFDALREKPVDILINNAGFADYGFFAESNAETMNEMLHVNIVALTKLTRLFLPPMLERKSGKILNVASVAAFFPGPLMSVYYASKAYVLSLSQALSNETAGSGVTVTCLCPGATTSEFQKVAGLQRSKLAAAPSMSAQEVAKIGVRALMRGQELCIPGFRNRLLELVPRLAPRGSLAGKVRRLQEPKPE